MNHLHSGEDAIGPVRAILNIVPDLANFVNKGGIQEVSVPSLSLTAVRVTSLTLIIENIFSTRVNIFFE